MEVWKIVYYSVLVLGIINLLVLHVTKIVVVDYIVILLIILVAILPMLLKISRLWYGDLKIEFSEKEVKEMEETGEEIISNEKFEEVKRSESELESMINELIDIGHYDFNLGLAAIRLRLEASIRNIFKNTLYEKISKKKYLGPGITWNLRMMSKKLYNQKIIDGITYGLLRKVINACNRAVHGFKIKDENLDILYDVALKLVAYFYGLEKELKTKKKK